MQRWTPFSAISIAALAVAIAQPACGQAVPVTAEGSDSRTTDAAARQPDAEASARGGAQVEDIVITARKTNERLNDVPLAVSAFSAKQIAARGLSDLADFSKVTPGFRFQLGTSSGRNDRSLNTLNFRGLVIGNDTLDNAGGLLFVDGAPVIGNQVPPVADVERVEVLKGPQSAFFGRSTFSGAVSFVTRDPPTSWTGDVQGSIATYDSYSVQASVGGPIAGDAVRFRLTGFRRVKGGQWDNAARPEAFGRQQTNSIAGTLFLQPLDQLRIKASANWFENDDGPPAQATFKQSEANCNLGGTLGGYYCGKLPSARNYPKRLISGNYVMDTYHSNNTFRNVLNFPTFFSPGFLKHGGLRRQAFQSSGRIDYEFDGGVTLSSLTAYHREKVQYLYDLAFRDGTAVPNPFFPVPNAAVPFVRWFLLQQQQAHDFSQEIRLASAQDQRFRWLIGGNYLEATVDTGAAFGPQGPGPAFSGVISRSSPKTPALFGAAYFDITPQLTLSGEVRYQVDKVRRQLLSRTGGILLPDPIRFRENYKSVSPRINLSYKIARDTLVYALWSRGYRPGGFNVALSPASTTPAALAALQAAAPGVSIAYDQERLDNYEVGFKARLFDGKLQLNVDAYYDKYSKGQVTQNILYVVTAPGTTPVTSLATVTRNTGKVRLSGIEGEATLVVSDALQLNGGFAFNDNRIKSGFCTDCLGIFGGTNPAGRRLQTSARYSGSLGAEYTVPLSDVFNAYGRADYSYRSRLYADTANIAYVGDKHNVDLRLGARSDRYTLEAFCTNCTQNLVADSALWAGADIFYLPATRQQIRYSLPDRRVFGLRASARF